MIILNSGKVVNLENLRSSDICIEDIAHSLSMICRFNGHCDSFYSVAQHSVRVSRVLPPELKLEGLLHDATEMLIGDLIRPVKKLFTEYIDLEEEIWELIAEKWNLHIPQHPSVDIADKRVLRTELIELFDEGLKFSNEWFPDLYVTVPIDYPWPPRDAEGRFLKEFNMLFKG